MRANKGQRNAATAGRPILPPEPPWAVLRARPRAPSSRNAMRPAPEPCALRARSRSGLHPPLHPSKSGETPATPLRTNGLHTARARAITHGLLPSSTYLRTGPLPSPLGGRRASSASPCRSMEHLKVASDAPDDGAYLVRPLPALKTSIPACTPFARPIRTSTPTPTKQHLLAPKGPIQVIHAPCVSTTTVSSTPLHALLHPCKTDG